MDKPKASRPQPIRGEEWRAVVYKYRGLLLAPVALLLLIFGRPTLLSAELGLGIAAAGEALRIWAVGYSGKTTRADVVTAPQLVTAGPYAMMRNPLYLGNILIALGFTVGFMGGIPPIQSYWLLAIVLALVIGVYVAVVPLEESVLARSFGVKYTQYTTQVPRIIPSRGPLPKDKQQGTWHGDVILSSEVTTLAFWVLMAVLMVLKLTVLGQYTLVP